MTNFPPPSGPPIQPRRLGGELDHRDGDRARRRLIILGAVAAVIVAGVVGFLVVNGDDDDSLAESTATTTSAPAVVPSSVPLTAPVTTATTTVSAPPTTESIATTVAPSTVPPTTSTAPATTTPDTTTPVTTAPPTPTWWDMTYSLDCGTGSREFTLVNGFFEDATPGAELYVELRRDVSALNDGLVVLQADCFTGGGAGVNVFILGLPDGSAGSPVVLPKNSVVAANDGATLVVETFDDTLQPPPVAVNRLAVINGQLTIMP